MLALILEALDTDPEVSWWSFSKTNDQYRYRLVVKYRSEEHSRKFLSMMSFEHCFQSWFETSGQTGLPMGDKVVYSFEQYVTNLNLARY